MVHSYNDV
jgi:threonine dehydratase